MNPVQSYFRWHDAKYLAYAENPRKLERSLRMLAATRLVLFLLSALLWMALVGVLAVTILHRDLFPEASLPALTAISVPVWLCYVLVTEAFLFRRYIREHKN